MKRGATDHLHHSDIRPRTRAPCPLPDTVSVHRSRSGWCCVVRCPTAGCARLGWWALRVLLLWKRLRLRRRVAPALRARALRARCTWAARRGASDPPLRGAHSRVLLLSCVASCTLLRARVTARGRSRCHAPAASELRRRPAAPPSTVEVRHRNTQSLHVPPPAVRQPRGAQSGAFCAAAPIRPRERLAAHAARVCNARALFPPRAVRRGEPATH